MGMHRAVPKQDFRLFIHCDALESLCYIFEIRELQGPFFAFIIVSYKYLWFTSNLLGNFL